MSIEKKKKTKYTKAQIKPQEKKDRFVFNVSWLKGRTNPVRSWHIKMGDEVIILSGKDKGKTGKVLQVFPKEGKVTVEGINIQTKHEKKPGQEKGQIIKLPGKLYICKVSLLATKDGKKVRTRVRYNEEGKRVAVKTGEVLD